MADALVRLAVWALRPVEAYWSWSVRRGYKKGRYKPPAVAVTTRRER